MEYFTVFKVMPLILLVSSFLPLIVFFLSFALLFNMLDHVIEHWLLLNFDCLLNH